MGEGTAGRRRPSVPALLTGGVLALGLALVLSRAFLFDLRTLATASMAPSMAPGDLLLVSRLSTPGPGDLVLLRLDDDEERYIKRVVAVPGEQLELSEGRLWVDGRAVGEDETRTEQVCGPGGARRSQVRREALGDRAWEVVPGGRDLAAQTVPDDAVFVLGDHRPRSMDSRTWGPIPLDDVVGVVVKRWDRGAPCGDPGG